MYGIKEEILLHMDTSTVIGPLATMSVIPSLCITEIMDLWWDNFHQIACHILNAQ